MIQIIKQNKDESRKQNYMYFFVVKASSLGKKKSNRFIKRNMLIVNLLILQLIQKSIEKNTVSLVIMLYAYFMAEAVYTSILSANSKKQYVVALCT